MSRYGFIGNIDDALGDITNNVTMTVELVNEAKGHLEVGDVSKAQEVLDEIKIALSEIV